MKSPIDAVWSRVQTFESAERCPRHKVDFVYCCIPSMGFQPGTQRLWDNSRSTKRSGTAPHSCWWYEFKGQKYYHNCKEQTSDLSQETGEYTELLTAACYIGLVVYSAIQAIYAVLTPSSSSIIIGLFWFNVSQTSFQATHLYDLCRPMGNPREPTRPTLTLVAFVPVCKRMLSSSLPGWQRCRHFSNTFLQTVTPSAPYTVSLRFSSGKANPATQRFSAQLQLHSQLPNICQQMPGTATCT